LHLSGVLLMAALRWMAFLIGIECLVCLFFTPSGPWSTALAVLFFICFVTVSWTVGAFSSTDSRKAPTS
jgi:uncharacterized membrane protein